MTKRERVQSTCRQWAEWFAECSELFDWTELSPAQISLISWESATAIKKNRKEKSDDCNDRA